MAIILAVVLAVMVVLDAVMFYVLRVAAVATRKQINACFVRELEDYDRFIGEKEEENHKLAGKKENLRREISDMEGIMVSLKTSPFYAPRPVPRDLFVPTARYIDNDFFDDHKLVKDKMKSLDKGEMMRQIREKVTYVGDLEIYRSACNILDAMKVDLLYELGTMDNEVQRAVLLENLQGTELKLLEQFLEERGEDERFDCFEFIAWLRELRTFHDPLMYARTGEEDEDFSSTGQDIVTQHDKNISEGLKIIYQNRLYDFSIYRSRSKK